MVLETTFLMLVADLWTLFLKQLFVLILQGNLPLFLWVGVGEEMVLEVAFVLIVLTLLDRRPIATY